MRLRSTPISVPTETRSGSPICDEVANQGKHMVSSRGKDSVKIISKRYSNSYSQESLNFHYQSGDAFWKRVIW